MVMQSLQAKFATQDQAESVMRKLASLRSDCFRLERVGSDTHGEGLSTPGLAGAGFQSSLEVEASLDAAGFQANSTDSVGASSVFTLSANVPTEATEQARTVILQAGGEFL
ncbi:hypothetical protein [Cohnella sp. WQ 127256]|uniref:hypothetical protein n=1 Tax=Cohnella sp. WQ 127256 TaxID=2938790 RepID=UPI002117BFD5|nr:hypothetical protein [Cohnella sp. WQ 127256]